MPPPAPPQEEGGAPRIFAPSAVRGMICRALRVASWWQPVEEEQPFAEPTPAGEDVLLREYPPAKRPLDKGEILERSRCCVLRMWYYSGGGGGVWYGGGPMETPTRLGVGLLYYGGVGVTRQHASRGPVWSGTRDQ